MFYKHDCIHFYKSFMNNYISREIKKGEIQVRKSDLFCSAYKYYNSLSKM